jgi:hypothetical protein
MFSIECHCGNIKLAAIEFPSEITSCNCSICYRLGALLAYYDEENVKVIVGVERKTTYSWGEKTMTYHRCEKCGCTTHYTTTEDDGNKLVAVNCRMAQTPDISKIPLREFDGLLTWEYIDE